MPQDENIRDLMVKLMRAIEASLIASDTVKDALQDIIKQGYDAKVFFLANAENKDYHEDELPVYEEGATLNGKELRFEFNKLDKDFLKSLKIKIDDK